MTHLHPARSVAQFSQSRRTRAPMTIDTFLSLLGLALAASGTPGPNNALLASSGANFGLRRTLPHMTGVALGFPIMIFIVGLFLGQLFQSSVVLRETLRWGGAAVMLWLAWKIATAGGISGSKGRPRPFTFVEAAAFQWINPKGWTMAVAITAQFISPARPVMTATVVALVFVVVSVLSTFTWAAAGRAMAGWLTTAGRLRWFNGSMAALMAASVLLLLVDR